MSLTFSNVSLLNNDAFWIACLIAINDELAYYDREENAEIFQDIGSPIREWNFKTSERETGMPPLNDGVQNVQFCFRMKLIREFGDENVFVVMLQLTESG